MLGENNSLLLDTTNILNKIDHFSSITIILIDNTNAFTKYKLNITVDPLVTPTFQIKTNFYLKWTTSISISIDAQSQPEVDVVDCDSKNQINNAIYNTKTRTVNINFKSYMSCRSMWVQLKSRDSWDQFIFSDKYIIYFDDGLAPAVTNTFGPISVLRGISKLFVIPFDLFTDSQDLTLTLDATNCINKSSIYTDIRIIKKNSNENYLFVQSNDTFSSWLFEIYATNVYGRSNQYQAQVNIIQWASKDWIEWTGSFQSDWVKWKDGYTVGDNGVWLLSFSLFSFNQFTIYKILSLIIWFLLFIHLVFIIKLKRLSFHSLFFVQPILIMIFSMQDVSDEMIVFTSYFQWTKLDLSFQNFIRFKFLGWNQSSEKMMKVHLYWQSTFHNYFLSILILIIIIIAVVKINKYSSQSIILQKLKMLLALVWLDEPSFFIFIFLNISQFFLSNILNDIINFRNQNMFSSISVWIWIIFCIYYTFIIDK